MSSDQHATSHQTDHQHVSPIRTPKQLITVVVLAFVVPVIVIILLASFVAGQKVTGAGSDSMSPEAIAERLRPVGSVAFASAPTGPRTLQSGEAVYKLACSACHATGVAGAFSLYDVDPGVVTSTGASGGSTLAAISEVLP